MKTSIVVYTTSHSLSDEACLRSIHGQISTSLDIANSTDPKQDYPWEAAICKLDKCWLTRATAAHSHDGNDVCMPTVQ